MNYFKECLNFPIYDLYSELNSLLEKNTISWSKENQICLNTTLSKPDDYLFGCGSLTHDWENAKRVVDQYGNESLEVPEYQKKYKEEEFSVLCSQFKNTLFEKIYIELSSQYKLGRIRIMKSKPKSCLSWHVDSSVRLHYPIKTQEGCFMVIENEVKHLPQNTWWWTDTRLPHTACNSSKEDRIHLVVVVL